MTNLSSYSELELMKLLGGNKKDSERAFTEIYARYSQRVYAYLLRILESTEDTQDVCQETFIRFYETYKEFKDLDNILGLLLKIARNLSLNYRRDKKIEIEFNEYIKPIMNFEFNNSDLSSIIDNTLKMIDFEYREIFILRLYEGLSYAEISELTGMKDSSARTKYQRAKDKIKEYLLPYLTEYYK